MNNKWIKGLVVAGGVMLLTASIALIVGVVRSKER